jgi:hypothetical protein
MKKDEMDGPYNVHVKDKKPIENLVGKPEINKYIMKPRHFCRM